MLPAALVASVAGCGNPQPLPSPTTLGLFGVAVGSEVSCATPAMGRMCDIWIATARNQASVSASDISSSVVHVAWSTVPRTTEVRVVVALTRRDGSTLYEPIFCGVPAVPDSACDFSGVSLPPN
jgi:hypothetical protein